MTWIQSSEPFKELTSRPALVLCMDHGQELVPTIYRYTCIDIYIYIYICFYHIYIYLKGPKGKSSDIFFGGQRLKDPKGFFWMKWPKRRVDPQGFTRASGGGRPAA